MGLTPKPRGNVINYYTGNVAITHSMPDDRYWTSLAIINDGISDLTFTINNMTITVKSSETFDDDFESFNSIRINTAIAYRLVLRG